MIIKNPNTNNLLVESVHNTANKLYESYTRARNINDFLKENGNNDDNRLVFNFIALNESVRDDDKKFTFDNGMYIPNISAKTIGRLSMTTMAESASNVNEFVHEVSTKICEDKLLFTPTKSDILRLTESYNEYKSSK